MSIGDLNILLAEVPGVACGILKTLLEKQILYFLTHKKSANLIQPFWQLNEHVYIKYKRRPLLFRFKSASHSLFD